ncbi:DUF4405 domain-containing protein [bacterium]|nr:DUF4405 domain-containing protein [bacterium]
MKNSKLNLIIDIIMFLVMMAIAGIGFLIKFALIPGFERNAKYGHDVELYYWGIDRHQWGKIHLLLGLVLLFLLLLHIIYHWKQIVSIFKHMVPAKEWRIVLTTIFVVFSIVLALMPLFVHPEIEEGVSHHIEHNLGGNVLNHEARPLKKQIISQAITVEIDTMLNSENSEHRAHSNKRVIKIYGYMTLNKVAIKYDMPVEKLASCIHVPTGHNDEKLGRLKKQFDFNFSDLRNFIEQNK